LTRAKRCDGVHDVGGEVIVKRLEMSAITFVMCGPTPIQSILNNPLYIKTFYLFLIIAKENDIFIYYLTYF